MIRILIFLLVSIVFAQNKLNMPYDFSKHQGYIINNGNIVKLCSVNNTSAIIDSDFTNSLYIKQFDENFSDASFKWLLFIFYGVNNTVASINNSTHSSSIVFNKFLMESNLVQPLDPTKSSIYTQGSLGIAKNIYIGGTGTDTNKSTIFFGNEDNQITTSDVSKLEVMTNRNMNLESTSNDIVITTGNINTSITNNNTISTTGNLLETANLTKKLVIGNAITETYAKDNTVYINATSDNTNNGTNTETLNSKKETIVKGDFTSQNNSVVQVSFVTFY